MNEYKPLPINTEIIELPEELHELTELLAKNVHEQWASQRLKDGWRFGPCRDDAKREHPCLIPYEELSEVEKEYDRKTAMETIKVILDMGYRITKG